jgi:hypothetical protein|tara:strand:- start:60 stop:722 length:663 start_codon:yes stop_codon:yes gene_type:complete
MVKTLKLTLGIISLLVTIFLYFLYPNFYLIGLFGLVGLFLNIYAFSEPEKKQSYLNKISQRKNNIIQASGNSFNIQPFIILLFMISLIGLFSMRLGFNNQYVISIFTAMFFITPFYFIVWLMWRFGNFDTYIGENGIVRNIQATSPLLGALGGNWIDTFIFYNWNDIRSYSYNKNKFKLYFNKGNIWNYSFFVDIKVEKNSEDYKIISKHLKNNSIPLKK